MMKRLTILTSLLLISMWIAAQQITIVPTNHPTAAPTQQRERVHFLSGWSLGLNGHVGYTFLKSPAETIQMFKPENATEWQGMEKNGMSAGAGVTLRIHFFDHARLGGDAYYSTLPLDCRGKKMASIWGGGSLDFYHTFRHARPYIGMGAGYGANMNFDLREAIILPGDNDEVVTEPADQKSLFDNMTEEEFEAYHTQKYVTLTPYLGVEIPMGYSALSFRLDWMLPFCMNQKGMSAKEIFQLSNMAHTSGPRLHVGLVFGKLKNKK